MRPEDILERDFMVGLRGYDKDEVRSFLAEIADAHGAALSELERLRSAPVTAPVVETAPVAEERDEFENLGASVAAILRAAKESAAELSGTAESQAAEIRAAAETQATETRESAERYAESVRGQADELRAQAQAAADELRGRAQTTLEDARAQADAILREANERASQISIEAEARVANKIEEAQRRAVALRASLTAASEELQLALVALDDDAVVDVREEESAGWVG